MIILVNTSNRPTRLDTVKADHRVSHLSRSVNDCRDDDCVILEKTEVREDIKDSIQSARNKISIDDGNICLNYNGDYFKFIDVAGDGDCFYHSILKYNTISEKFNCVQELRIYMRDTVNHLFFHDQVLQHLFSHHRIDFLWWCSNITRMGVWANTFDTLIFSYVTKLNVITIGNYRNGMIANSMYSYLLQLGFSNIIPDRPAIHVYFHIFGRPFEKVNNGNHFAYLEPIISHVYDSVENGLEYSHKPNIISQESDVIELEQSSSTTSTQSQTQTPSSPSTQPTQPNISTQPTQLTLQTPNTTPMQPSTQSVQSRTNTPILPVVPNLCSKINRNETLDECLTYLSRTKTTGCNHKACVCVICDCFIIGVEKICWLSEEKLIAKQSYLSVHYLEATNNKTIPTELRNQYKIHNNDSLTNLLLSPRACVTDGKYMACKPCHTHIRKISGEKPPKFAISNGWLIGEIPNAIVGHDIDDILASSVAKVRIFANVFSYSAGAHKTIKGHHVFFIHDPEHVGASFEYMLQSGSSPDMYVMICGRVTPAQRDIIKRRVSINVDEYKAILNWLIDNHPSYNGMHRPESCPQPVLVGGFDEDTNNTDECKDDIIESTFEGDQMTFAPSNEPTQTTGPFQSNKEFILSYLGKNGTKPTLLLKRGDCIGGHKVNLIDLFPLIFPYGWGGPDEKHATKVSKSAVLRHYCRISLPQMQQPQFLLVLCSMWQRMESFTKCTISCRSNFKSSTLADELSLLTQAEVGRAARHLLNGEKTDNETLKKLFSSIRGQSSALGHSNEAASFARQKLFSLWHYFGAPAVFFTVTPCDECSFRVRLYATGHAHKLPSIDDIEDKAKCLLDFNARKKWRAKYPGACAIEYDSVLQVVIAVLIGWDQENHKGSSGIFGIPEAYADCCEEQARYTLHSHISIWIENFNDTRNLLFHENERIRQKSKKELELYFNKIAQSSFGDMYDFDLSTISTPPSDCEQNIEHSVLKVNDILQPPKDQDLRNMRHHIHCQDLNGVIGYYPQVCQVCEEINVNSLGNKHDHHKGLNTDEMVYKNTQVTLGGMSSINHFNKNQLDMLAYTYPYDMQKSNDMKPRDCQSTFKEPENINTLEYRVTQFNLRHPLIQLKFNVHDYNHRPSCFKKGPECRTELPQKHRAVAEIQFDNDKCITWHFIDGSTKKVAPFKYHPKRNIGDQFMNVNNDIATTVFACNNNVTIGDKACFFYVTLYQTKHNQKEESCTYHSICLALSKRIKRQQDMLTEQRANGIEVTEEISKDYCEGLCRMLSSLYGHTTNNVLSATMAWTLLSHSSRFKFSHDSMNIPLQHLLQWLNGNDNLEFKLKTVKNSDGEYSHIQDMYINNMIYRPTELEYMSCYDMITHYELRKMSKKKIKSGNHMVESKKNFNLLEEHPSHKCMVMSKRKNIFIPCINSINLLPNIADLRINSITTDVHTLKRREEYAKIVLLLFYPYRIRDDLMLNESYWDRYKMALSKNIISTKDLEVCQNIQDVCHNLTKLKVAQDDLLKTTTYVAHELDNKHKHHVNDEPTISFDQIADMFQQQDNYGVRQVHPTKRSLSIIASRCNIIQQKIPECGAAIPNITDIPEFVTNSCGLLDATKKKRNQDLVDHEQHSQNRNNIMSCVMVIEILNDVLVLGLSMPSTICEHDLENKLGHNVENLSFKHIISKYKLDFKQSVAFEIMSCSFMLKSLKVHHITEDSLQQFFQENEDQRNKYTDCLKGFQKSMKDRGGEDHLIMFLSGMGGTGKSEVIKAFVEFVEGISIFFDWNYNSDVIKVSAYTGAAACQIPNGRTLHSTVSLGSPKCIGPGMIDSWKSTQMLIIDEVSFLSEPLFEKTDKHMRMLKEEKDIMFGGCHIILVGDFFQLLPVGGGLPLFKCNTLQFGAINKAIFLNVSHRFYDDHAYGEIMRRFRMGLVTKEDIKKINTRFIKNDNVSLPPITKLRCACYTNNERNAYTNTIFIEHLKATHIKADNDTNINDDTVQCPDHTCIIKSSMRYRNKKSGPFNRSMYNRLLDECGDASIKNSSNSFVEPALKFFYNIPLMTLDNGRIDEGLANGTPCRGLYLKLKEGCHFVKENWEGYMVNTVSADDVDHMVCMIECDPREEPKYFTVKPTTGLCKITLKQFFNNTALEPIRITYLPINSNISTTGHKLQGSTLDKLVVNSWTFSVQHWAYVVLSRVRTLANLVLNEELDENRSYSANSELVRWETNIKDSIEKKTFKDRGKYDYERYLEEEQRYNGTFP